MAPNDNKPCCQQGSTVTNFIFFLIFVFNLFGDIDVDMGVTKTVH